VGPFDDFDSADGRLQVGDAAELNIDRRLEGCYLPRLVLKTRRQLLYSGRCWSRHPRSGYSWVPLQVCSLPHITNASA
jgi:hypothetical protein